MSGTFDIRDGMRPVCHGVAVGDGRYGLVLSGPSDAELLEAMAWVSQWSPIVGTWEHGGRVYVDPVTIVDAVAAALELAAERGELAVFDLDTMTEYSVQVNATLSAQGA